MAKAWRKHNMELAGKIAQIDYDIQAQYYLPPDHPEIIKLQEKRKQLSGLHLHNKTERRMQYAAEVSQPSNILYTLFANVGLPVPPEFLNALRMAGAKQ